MLYGNVASFELFSIRAAAILLHTRRVVVFCLPSFDHLKMIFELIRHRCFGLLVVFVGVCFASAYDGGVDAQVCRTVCVSVSYLCLCVEVEEMVLPER